MPNHAPPIVKLYRDKAADCLRRAAAGGIKPGVRLQYERLAECYSDLADVEEGRAAKRPAKPRPEVCPR
jgi:hypothetical protein